MTFLIITDTYLNQLTVSIKIGFEKNSFSPVKFHLKYLKNHANLGKFIFLFV